jgi:hypothetical protein
MSMFMDSKHYFQKNYHDYNFLLNYLLLDVLLFKQCFIDYSSSPSHIKREPIIPDEDQEKTGTIVDNIKDSLNLLANILDYDQKESFDKNHSGNEIRKEPTNSNGDEQIPDMNEYKDIIKENNNLKREILFLKQLLLDKVRKIQKMEFMNCFNHCFNLKCFRLHYFFKIFF